MLTRRALLRLSASIGLSAASLGALAESVGSVPADPLVSWIFRSRESAVLLGAEYLRREPAERDLRKLRELLGLRLEAAADPSEDEVRAQAAALLERHRDDFREGRVRRIGGWTLSLTELRLCAMVFLAAE